MFENKHFSFFHCQKSKIEFQFFLNQIFGFPWCSTREDLSIDVSISNRTDIDEAKVISAICQKARFEFQTFLSQKLNFSVSMV